MNDYMNDCYCYVNAYIDGKFTTAVCSACWSMLIFDCNFFGINNTPVKREYKTFKCKEIFIRQYEKKRTERYQQLLIDIINEITPCSFVVIDKVNYIKFMTLDSYDRSLILLNFIRNLWYQPSSHPNYTNKFFTALEDSHNHYKDALERLTWANKEACSLPNETIYHSPGHCNIHAKDKLKIRHSKELFASKTMDLHGTMGFLTGLS